jgi:hypothetical protein
VSAPNFNGDELRDITATIPQGTPEKTVLGHVPARQTTTGRTVEPHIEGSLKVGEFEISTFQRGKVWIETRSGEAMEIPARRFVALLEALWKNEF